ncbi:putative DNA primase/helicase [Scopulibacillus darangshiensis]|uniref:Putative DNA primase/helicase n=1 Tax=Scopulibacillus darangshiensis TaxID=442528 RepID=A0A4R2PAP9_9BACL|nr:phage/plasmid primase, P4 family [Scopulibacillus darangshiensis]TCP32159.1 putative DNA primase/helicase [Scopulibacillus darangshiensis]
MNFNNIPIELQSSPQWILWRSEEREGKPTKVPYQSNGYMAKSNDKKTWSTFQTATASYENGGFDGIGFMFSKDDPFIGVDIDHCVRDGELSTLANYVVDLMDSYTEFSPSGEGVHVIVKGELPIKTGTGKKNPKIGLEVYRHGRYFTFTGDSLDIGEVNERSDELRILFQDYFEEKKPIQKQQPINVTPSTDNLSNSELWNRMFDSRKGSDIQALFQGQLINGDHSSTDMALCNHLAFWTDKDAAKMDSMFRESNLYREKWDKQHSSDGSTYGQMTINEAIQTTPSTISELLDQQEYRKPYEVYISTDDTNTFSNENDNQDEKKPFFRLTELGNAERLVYHHGKNIRYCNELEWLVWNGKYWEEDNKRQIESIAAGTFRKLYKEAAETDEDDKTRRKQLYEWAQKCERRSVRINSILDSRPMVSVKKNEFDSHKFLFNCENGIVDLKTGKIMPHDRGKLFTKISHVAYEKDADCPNWKAFLESIFKDESGNVDHEVINFMQKAVGYSLTGDISEQVMFFLFGNGRNGKSTFINTVQTLLGDYGRQTNSDTFIKKKNDNAINNDIARLDGARFVSAVESEEGQQLSESLVKQITGGEKMSARFLRQEFFEFAPEFKVFFTTNHKPIIKNNDTGIWRRVRLIPFTVTIPKEDIDKDLPKKLEKEMPGILRWAVEGCLKWRAEGLGEPEAVKQATEGYRQDMDIMGPFIQEKCIVHSSVSVEAKELYEEYKDWCFKNNEFEFKNRAFYRQIETRGFKKVRGNFNKNYFSGLGLIRQNLEKSKNMGIIGNLDEEGDLKSNKSNKNKVTNINRKRL